MATTFDTGYVPTGTTLSNGNRTATRALPGENADNTTRTAHSFTGTEKVYIEVTFGGDSSSVNNFTEMYMGVLLFSGGSQFVQGNQIGDGNGLEGVHTAYGSGFYCIDAVATIHKGDTVCFAIDCGAGKWCVRLNNGGWYTGSAATGNWTTGGNPTNTSLMRPMGISGTLHFGVDIWEGGNAATINTQASEWVYSPPSGYTEINAGSGGSTVSGTGSTAGVGAAAGQGRASTTQSGSSPSSGAAVGQGRATTTQSGTAAGVGAASGQAVSGGSGTAAGVGAATGVGQLTNKQNGSTAGVGAAAGAGLQTITRNNPAAGVGAAAATGFSTVSSNGTAAGVGAILGQTQAGFGTGAAAGVGAATGQGSGVTPGVGSTAGVGAAQATGSGLTPGVGSTAGVGAAAGQGQTIVTRNPTAAGVGAAAGIPIATTYVGLGAGVGAATGQGKAIASTTGTAAGRTILVIGVSANGTAQALAADYWVPRDPQLTVVEREDNTINVRTENRLVRVSADPQLVRRTA